MRSAFIILVVGALAFMPVIVLDKLVLPAVNGLQQSYVSAAQTSEAIRRQADAAP